MAEQKSIYDDLTAAFGKNGIQALIIDAWVVIENSHNRLIKGRALILYILFNATNSPAF